MQVDSIRLMLNNRKIYIGIATLALLVFAPKEDDFNQLESVMERGTLRVASRLGPLSYFERDGQPNGLDYNLLSLFAANLGVSLEFVLYDNLEAQLASVYTKNIDLAAATLTETEDRRLRYEFSEPYMEVAAVLIQHSSEPPKDSLDELQDEDYNLRVIAGSSHAELLHSLKKDHPHLEWNERPEVIMFQLMEQVQNREIDYAVVDSAIFELERSMFPRVEAVLELSDPAPIGMAFPKSPDRSLLEMLNEFIRDYEARGELEMLRQAYFVDDSHIDVGGALVFKERLVERLPEFEELFRTVAAEMNYDWLLLAAQAYQESHWEPLARSPTGVRGLMMLTLPTARQLGVTSRLDPVQSLRGGVRYMISLHSRMPERIPEPDRTKFALAAYNVGFGHLNDARILAQRAGANPDSWDVVAEYLPLLRQRRYYSTLEYGFARGNEPVAYVENIYRFKGILEWYIWQRDLDIENMFVEPGVELEQPRDAYQGILDMPLSPL